MSKKIADATETATPEGDEGGTSAEDAFEDELGGVIAEALDDEDDEDDDEIDDDDVVDDEDLDDDEDEEDLDDGEDDEDDEDEDEEEEGGEVEQARDETGKFAKPDDAKKEGDDKAKPDAAAAAAAGTETKPDAAAAAAPKWEAYSVNVDKQAVPIEEAKISRVNGHVFLAMPEKDFNRFNQRVSRGVVGERLWRDLHNGLRELEARKSAPAPKSDAEIEAEMTLAVLKPHLADILDDKDVELLEARIKIAKGEAKDAYTKSESERMSKAAETPWEEQQVEGIKQSIAGFLKAFPELQSLTGEELDEIYQREFLPVKNSLVFKEGDAPFANTQWMFDRLKARADSKKAAGNAASSAPAQTPGASTGNSASTATPDKGTTKTDKAERFNRGVDASKPKTTSVKANRDTDRPRKRSTRDDDGRRRRRKVRNSRDEQRDAEDDYRKTERAFLNSPDLDFSFENDE